MTIEERRQIKVAKIWMKTHLEYIPNEIDARALCEVLSLNDLDFTIPTLNLAYQILKFKEYKFLKFSKEKLCKLSR